MKAIEQGNLSLSGIQNLLKSFKNLTDEINYISTLNLHDLVDVLLPKNDDACSVLREIAEHALETSKDIHQLFDSIKTSIIRPEIFEDDFVRIMSPRKAKGLSSRVVIVASCIEALFPDIKDDSPLNTEDQISEQRRLFYVAITRCTEILVLSSFTWIYSTDARRMGISVPPEKQGWLKQNASRFIGELGPNAPRSQRGEEWQASGYNEKDA